MNLFNNREVEFDRRILMLENQMNECDIMHKAHKEHQKRHDDSMNNLTESNVMLAKALNEINITLSRLTLAAESDKDIMAWLRNVSAAFTVNKKIFSIIVAVALGITAITAAVRLIPW